VLIHANTGPPTFRQEDPTAMTMSAGRNTRTAAVCLLALLSPLGCGDDADLMAPDPVGTLLVETEPYGIDAGWTVSGPGGFRREGQAHGSLTGLAAGPYTVSWQDVAGWDTPADLALDVALGEVATAAGLFTSRVWRALDTGVDTDLLDVQFLDTNQGWAVGEGGVILHTVDGGATWSHQVSTTSENLAAVSFCNAEHGYAVGTGGTILRTFDGGIKWWRQKIERPTDWWGNPIGPEPPDFVDVDMFDPSRATVVGLDGGSYRTLTGGNDWFRQTTASGFDIYGVDYTSADHGVFVGERGLIMRTVNGGASWRIADSGTDETLMSVSFADTDHGTAVGRGGTVLRTVDSGLTWTVQDSGCDAYLYDVSFVDADHGVIVGNEGAVLRTTDGGATWIPEAGGTFRFLLGVDLVDGGFGTMVGLDGMMFRSVTPPEAAVAAAP
jgi:photosystem II stability/assembly factor-like uncharacterized protein